MALKKIGSLWKKENGGKTVLSGKTEREGITLPPNAKLLLFKNDKGDNAKRPDYTLHIGLDDDLAAPPSGYEEPQPPPDSDGLDF